MTVTFVYRGIKYTRVIGSKAVQGGSSPPISIGESLLRLDTSIRLDGGIDHKIWPKNFQI